jgi:hypothetical protein
MREIGETEGIGENRNNLSFGLAGSSLAWLCLFNEAAKRQTTLARRKRRRQIERRPRRPKVQERHPDAKIGLRGCHTPAKLCIT